MKRLVIMFIYTVGAAIAGVVASITGSNISLAATGKPFTTFETMNIVGSMMMVVLLGGILASHRK